MRSVQEKVCWAAASSSVLLLAGVALPVAARAAKKHGPDLVVRVAVDDLGTPPHILVGASGTAPRFRVVVRTENQGDRTAGRSKTSLTIDSGELAKPYRWKVKRLGPGDTTQHTVVVEDLRPDLGFTDVRAKADSNHAVGETDEGNNAQAEKVAVEPREWDVPMWNAEATRAGIDNVTKAGAGFYLRFQKYDAGFVYQASGPVTDTPKSYPGCALVFGSKTITQTPWGGSVFKIDPDLRGYHAFVPAASSSFMATCGSGGASFPIQVGFLALETGPGSPKKQPEDAELEGVDSVTTAGESWAWKFRARVPKP